MKHLDDALYHQLLADPSLLDAALRAHLQSGCEDCSGYLQTLPVADALDGRVDSVLLALANRARVAPPSQSEVRRVMAGLAPSPGLRGLRLGALAAGIVAVGLGVRLAWRPAPITPYSGMKGVAPLTLAASVAAVSPAGQVTLAASGATFPPADALSVRIDLSRRAAVSLVRVSDAQGVEVLALNLAISQGKHDLSREGKPVGVPLEGLSGAQHLVVVASDGDLTQDQAVLAARGDPVAGAVTSRFDFQAVP